MNRLIFLLFFLICLSCTKDKLDLETESISVEQYKGKWFEIARLQNSFEKHLECVTATYSVKENGRINVLNQGYNTKKEKQVSAKGEAKPAIADDFSTGKLKVSFFKPFWGDYYVIDIGENYEYALVGNPGREYLWILARESKLPQEKIDQLIDLASAKGFPVEDLYFTKHDCNAQVAYN